MAKQRTRGHDREEDQTHLGPSGGEGNVVSSSKSGGHRRQIQTVVRRAAKPTRKMAGVSVQREVRGLQRRRTDCGSTHPEDRRREGKASVSYQHPLLEAKLERCTHCRERVELVAVGFAGGPYEAASMLCHRCVEILFYDVLPLFGVFSTDPGERVTQRIGVPPGSAAEN